MKNNVGINDKIVRMILAAACAMLAFQFHFAFGFVSLAIVATVVFSWCPINQTLRINTAEREVKQA
ncbi:MAG: DUF2892 domain-containing protein [Bacteroidota bacterium]|nr:DUF2892 domain-containing protein [Bacteroidota bacterium]